MPIAIVGPEPHPARSMREAILDAAERRFADRGFDGVSVREIISDAGLRNQASLYHYFANKRALYEAVLRRGVSAIVGLLAEHGARPASPQEIAADLGAVLLYLTDHPQLARLVQRAALDDNAFVRSAIPRLLRPLYEHGLQMLGHADGAWEEAELPYLAAGLYHLIFGYFADEALLQSLLDEDPRSPAALDRHRRFLTRAVTRLLGPDRPSDTAVPPHAKNITPIRRKR